ncbi:Redox-sensitive transcriptional activator SoxR [Pseudoalteromonas sp. P1-9]|uniref:redox-sensitive transcriptional activator SoxR n=1 Tax=Pseudoalteromonas sp. P1-9 TaxID=1710354 RepID=UPI0006D62F24|nr:redox-sensitive transcriptional activator SoxR [Pseudoalteromonas sp. P1-9]KPV96415.1 Redox-sensitive transcriptional activator SoxR [Pseudoalteromonas sp. P1-9]
MADANLSVGNIAKRAGVKVSTLHFYEEKGLIRSWRNSGNQRRYKPDVLRRIALIKAGQKIGVSLNDIKAILSQLPNERTPTVSDWEHIATAWRDKLTQQILYIEKLKDSLTSCIGCGCLSLERCHLYNQDDCLKEEGEGAVILERK